MIGKAKSCVGGYALFHYVMSDAKGFELLRNNLCGETPLEIMEEMKILQNINQRAENKLISMVLSPTIEDGKNLSENQLKQIALDFLIDMKVDVENQQFLAFVHTEKQHKHIHFLINRVDEKGKLISDHYIGKKAQWSAHRIAEKWDLISAKQLRMDKLNEGKQENTSVKTIKNRIKENHLEVMKTCPLSLEKYLSEMCKLEVKFIPTQNKQGQLQGFRVKDLLSQTEYKASDIHKSLGLKSLLEAGLPILDTNILLHSTLIQSQEKAKLRAKEIEKQRKENVEKMQFQSDKNEKIIRFKR